MHVLCSVRDNNDTNDNDSVFYCGLCNNIPPDKTITKESSNEKSRKRCDGQESGDKIPRIDTVECRVNKENSGDSLKPQNETESDEMNTGDKGGRLTPKDVYRDCVHLISGNRTTNC